MSFTQLKKPATCILYASLAQSFYDVLSVQISHAVLVELAGGSVSHAETSRIALEAISPKAELIVVHAQRE